MGANISTQKPERERSMAIDKQIEEDSRRCRNEIKVLLLGTPGSDSSAIVRQMRMVHGNGYTPDELAAYRLVVYENLIDSAKNLVLTVQKIAVEDINRNPILLTPTYQKYAAQILEYQVGSDSSFRLAPDIANAIDSLWKDPATSTAMERSSEFCLPDSAGRLFSRVQMIAWKDYIPSEKDILEAETKPTGIVETKFDMGQLSICILDMSGQRSERKKWIHCFESVASIIFCTALSDYDQVLLEERGQNRMAESLVLFESVVNSRWFSRTSVVLFFTKIDVFKSKLAKVPLERYFPDYSGGANIDKAAKYILWRYTQANRARLSIYPHLVQKDDTSNIRLVFAAFKETILQHVLRDSRAL